ncbi:hypothetical protein ACJMK2_032231, partial [Sinanodonta woodiana]
SDQLSGVKLFIGNVSRPWMYNQEIPSNTSSMVKLVYKPNYAIASVISLMRVGPLLALCEVTVEGECLNGMFSEFCNLTCGRCFADQPCDKDNGTCPMGCDQGWKGKLCKEGCERGNYAYNCNETCGNCLYGNNSCSVMDGKCSNGCKAGWQGDQCNIGCERGTYGYNCIETCGHCLYGNTSCDTANGNCINGCIAEWQGYSCKRGTLGTIHGDVGPNVGVIVGAVLTVVGVSIFALVIIIVIVKNGRKKDKVKSNTDNVTTPAQYANMVVGNPACNNVRSREESETTFTAIEAASPQTGMPIEATKTMNGLIEHDVLVHNSYEKLRYVTDSTESAYTTLDHNLEEFIEALQSIEEKLRNLEEKRKYLVGRNEINLRQELAKTTENEK